MDDRVACLEVHLVDLYALMAVLERIIPIGGSISTVGLLEQRPHWCGPAWREEKSPLGCV